VFNTLSIYSKLAVFIILFTFLVGCKAKSPTSSSSDASSSTSTDTGTDTGTGTTSYVGKWVKSGDNSYAMDWRSDSFIYTCLVSTYTHAAHASYSSSNSRLTFWDGSYGTVTSSGSNFILGGATTYVPAILYSTCNPFWTNSTSENTYYTNASRSIGYWKFTYTLVSTWDDYPLMSTISTRRTSDNNYYTYGTDESGNEILGTYQTSTGKWDILDTSASNINQYYAFKINSSNSGIDSGWYYQYNKSTSTWGSGYAMTALKIYGTPMSYRTINENSVDEIMKKKEQEMVQAESMRSNSRLTNKDLKAFKRYKQLLQILNSSDKEPLKKYLQSFRTN